MGRPNATTRVSAAAALVWLACGWVNAQDPGPQVKFWPRLDISFPIDVTVLDTLNPRPVSIRFYAAPPDKSFKLIANRTPNELDKIVDKQDSLATPRRGFAYVAAADGVEDFAVQYEFADGKQAPKTPVAQYRIHFDTKPPVVKATATATNSIRWLAEDENLAPSSIRIEGRYPGETQWQVLNVGDLRADDSFKWNTLPPNKTLEVRVFARDRAGNGGYSPVLKLGAKSDRADADLRKPPGSFGDPPTKSEGRTGSGFGGLDEFPTGRPKMQYISTRELTVRSKVTHVTRSGVKAAQLYVQHDTADWRSESKKEGLAMWPDTPDAERIVEIPFSAPRDGLYGFIIHPISGANTKADEPRPGDPAQYLVEVDTIKPELNVKTVRVAGSGLTGPLIEIEWFSQDKNEMPEPIDLEYHDNEADMRQNKGWKPIAAKIVNSGRYTWEITDKKLWRFWVRATARDKAGNTSVVVYSDDKNVPIPILVDLDKPTGNVEKVDESGKPMTPRKQVNHTDDRFGQPGTLNVRPISGATEPAPKAAPLGVGGRVALPSTDPKKTEPKPIAPPTKSPVEPTKVPDVGPLPMTSSAGGTVPIPELPPISGSEKK
jgi:hypothetical protein